MGEENFLAFEEKILAVREDLIAIEEQLLEVRIVLEKKLELIRVAERLRSRRILG